MFEGFEGNENLEEELKRALNAFDNQILVENEEERVCYRLYRTRRRILDIIKASEISSSFMDLLFIFYLL